MNELLSDSEIEQITKAKQSSKQASILDMNGIYYIRRADGSICTTWHHVNHPARMVASNDDTPDFSAIG